MNTAFAPQHTSHVYVYLTVEVILNTAFAPQPTSHVYVYLTVEVA